jgi:NitT/TauT family transport system substrate-binding protein
MSTPQSSQVGPTVLGKLVLVVIVLALLGGAAYFFKDVIAPSGKQSGDIDLDQFKAQQGTADDGDGGVKVEAPDSKGITTVNEYAYVPGERLPAVKGVSAYKWNASEKVVEFPINVWIGWLPIVAANGGFKPNADSIFFKEYGFKVNLKLIDDPVVARDAYAAGESHVLWGTLDMMALFAPGLMKDSRTAPRIYQQIDWSSGGDGVVVRDGIKSVKDLRGKTIVYAQNSPSQYFINNLLLNAGIQPSEVKHKYTASAFEAAAAFVSDKSIDACVSWAPDIYNIPDRVPGTRILTTTAEANQLIADVWAVRADFAKDHPDIVRGLVEGIFKGMDRLKDNTAKAKAFEAMAEGYGFSLDEVKAMEQDAHVTNFAENKAFFLNQNNPANFERTWKNITFVYRELGLIDTPVRFDEVMDFSILQAIDKAGTFKASKDEYQASFVPTTYSKVQAEAPILTQTIRINFYPNSSNLYEPEHDDAGNTLKGSLYDPNVEATVEKVGRLAGQYARATIAIVGHSDSSMKGKGVRFEDVQKLSYERADAVKKALIKKFNFAPDKFVVEGKGWNNPAVASEPDNHAQNRRVEISVYPPEALN